LGHYRPRSMLFSVPLPSCSTVCSVQKFKIGQRKRSVSAPVPSIRIPGVIRKSGESQLQIDNFKWHLPLIYTHCLETIWNFLEKIHAFYYISSHSQNASKLSTEKLPKYSKPRSFRWDFAPGRPAGDFKRSPDPSPTFVPPNTKSWIRSC
jgi:hypothetical protein